MNMCLKGNLPASFAALTLLLIMGMATSAPAVGKWYDPCELGSSSPPTNVNLGEVMASAQNNALEVRHSALAYKTFLTAGSNPRVSNAEIGLLDSETNPYHVQNFPYDFEANSNPTDNVTAVLITDYIYLSKVYIFFQQAKYNADTCDTRSDSSEGLTKIQSILSRTQQTLCDVSTYLTASGHPMPADQIPGKDEVLNNSVPNVKTIGDTCDEDIYNIRNQVDYLLARDSKTTSANLHYQYSVMYTTLYPESQ